MVKKRQKGTIMELPPRARRIHYVGITYHDLEGTTSACAENTRWLWIGSPYRGNYLRVRGEYQSESIVNANREELPPRARRIL